MVQVKNVGGTYRLQNRYVWLPGDVLDVPEEAARHVLETYPERFILVAPVQENPVADAPDRMQRGGRRRAS